MKNLAGVQECDQYIRKELEEAGITAIPVEQVAGEVSYSIEGQLSCFRFSRAWYYWVVDGDVPLEVANEMHATEIGKKDIRVAGHCGRPEPKEWAFPKEEIIEELGLMNTTFGELAEMCNKGEIDAPRFVSEYHIDSQEGLNLFAETIKRHQLM